MTKQNEKSALDAAMADCQWNANFHRERLEHYEAVMAGLRKAKQVEAA